VSRESEPEVGSLAFQPCSPTSTSFACKCELEVGFYYTSPPFPRPPSPSRATRGRSRLPTPQRAGGVFLLRFGSVCAASTSLACKSKPEADLWYFNAVRTSSTFLARKTEPAVDPYRFSSMFTPPSPTRASWRSFRCCLRFLCLTRLQELTTKKEVVHP